MPTQERREGDLPDVRTPAQRRAVRRTTLNLPSTHVPLFHAWRP